jgi:ribonuclease-3
MEQNSLTLSIQIEVGKLDSYRFTNSALLQQALTHKSMSRPGLEADAGNYERLEFLGDSVLGLLVSEYLWRRFPEKSEGELSRLRAQLVNEESLASIARLLHLSRHIIVGNGERESGGNYKESILADVFEALVGALYIDGGLEVARRFVEAHLSNSLENITEARTVTDFKTELQEVLQAEAMGLPVYRIIAECGPPHNRSFEVEVVLGGEIFGRGSGSSKKAAEANAAMAALAIEKWQRDQFAPLDIDAEPNGL